MSRCPHCEHSDTRYTHVCIPATLTLTVPAGPEPAPSAEPEMPEGWTAVCAVPGAPVVFRRNGPGYKFVTLEVMRQLLATQGLVIIPAAELEGLRKQGADAEAQHDASSILAAYEAVQGP